MDADRNTGPVCLFDYSLYKGMPDKRQLIGVNCKDHRGLRLFGGFNHTAQQHIVAHVKCRDSEMICMGYGQQIPHIHQHY